MLVPVAIQQVVGGSTKFVFPCINISQSRHFVACAYVHIQLPLLCNTTAVYIVWHNVYVLCFIFCTIFLIGLGKGY